MAKSKKAKKSKGVSEVYPPLSTEDSRDKRSILRRKVRPVSVQAGMKASDLVSSMAGMSIQARNLGRCAEVLDGMYSDKARPTVLLGLAGPLIAAGLRNVIRDLVVGGYVDVVVSTGDIDATVRRHCPQEATRLFHGIHGFPAIRFQIIAMNRCYVSLLT